MVLRIVSVAMALLIATTSAQAETPLAQVGRQVIDTDQLDQAWQRKNGSPRVADSQVGQVGEVLQELVQFELLYADATRLGYEKKPELVKAIQRLIVDEYMTDTLLPKLADITVDEEEIEAFYQSNTDLFTLEPKSKGALIQVSVPTRVSAERKVELQQRAESARKEALLLDASVADFGGVAVKYSDHQATRYRGGNIGWLGEQNRWDQQILDEFRNLDSTGAISEVVETDEGFYVLRIVELKPATVQPLVAVQEQIRHQLFRDKRKAVKDRFYASLGQAINVQLYQDNLDEWISEAGAIADAPPSQPD